MNSNVAIETGYALRALGDQKFLMVMNTAFCRFADKPYDDLPFDLRHKAGLIIYHLKADSSPEDIKSSLKQLTNQFKFALKPMLSQIDNDVEKVDRIQSNETNRSLYFNEQDPLVRKKNNKDDTNGYEEYFLTEKPIMYLRISPVNKINEINRVSRRKKIKKFLPFATDWTSADFKENAFGGISFWANYEEKRILAGVQLFANGEVWAFNNNHPPKRVLLDKPNVPLSIHVLENTYRELLPLYLEQVKSELTIEPPYDIEAGISGYDTFLNPEKLSIDSEIFDKIIFIRKTIHTNDIDEVNSFLLEFFEKVWTSSGVVRPENFSEFPDYS